MSNVAAPVLSRRRSGVLLPASALRHDQRGALGDGALRFIDWLADAGFTVWQLLPLVPTDESGSPYWARSDRAGNIALTDALAPDPGSEDDFAAFRAASSGWLDDYTLFEALSAEQGGAPWWNWPEPLRRRDPQAFVAARQRFALQLSHLARAQWRFDEQWRALRRQFGLPGMRVLQFGFDGDAANLHLPHAHSADCVVYTGTHDNDTTVGWYASLDERARDHVRRYFGRPDHEVVDALLRAGLSSVGVLAVLPMQDILQLGSGARLNRPGTTTGNWAWRLPGASLTPDLAARYRDLNQLYDRS